MAIRLPTCKMQGVETLTPAARRRAAASGAVKVGKTQRPVKEHHLARSGPRSILLSCLAGAALLSGAAGCANTRMTTPPRTATEQFLLSEAVVAAVRQLSFEGLRGHVVYIDAAYAPAEKDYVVSELRAQLLLEGVRVASGREGAQIILEVRSGGVGIDIYESLFGIPALTAPAGATTAATGAPLTSILVPEVAITKRIKQLGFAKIGYVAYWAKTGEIVASSGPSLGRTLREDWWILGFGPRTVGNIPPVDHNVDSDQLAP